MKSKFDLATIVFFISCNLLQAQGLNHNFLIGYTAPANAIALIDTNSFTIFPQSRKMRFLDAQANISDSTGNLLFYTNGGWIANSTGDTMMNGGGLNPGNYASANSNYGFTAASMEMILPYPDSLNKYVLFHQTISNTSSFYSTELFYSLIDMSLDSGKGGVVQNQKNIVAFSAHLCFGISACKHANGRDWWITILKDSSDMVYLGLLTPYGISPFVAQHLNTLNHSNDYLCPILFSPNGNKFAMTYTSPTGNTTIPYNRDLRIFDFDRCSGIFSNPVIIDLQDTFPGIGISFSSNSRYIYTAKYLRISQFDLQAANIESSRVYVADYDTFMVGAITDFGNMYLAANGKIYGTSTGSTTYFNVINNPDTAGLFCNVQQHSVQSPCYIGANHVNHPNYYLGRLIGSACDTVWQGIEETQHDFRFRIYPNPVMNNSLTIGYLLPQNKAGVFSIYDVTGKIVFKYSLPQWSNEQSFSLPVLSNGVYNCVINSSSYRVSKRVVVIK